MQGGTVEAEAILADIKQQIDDHPIFVFLKGTVDHPMCGFSAATVEVLRRLERPFGWKNVLEDPEYRYTLAEYSNWSTIPQVFMGGKFVGGSDIVHELFNSGDLARQAAAAFE